MAAVVVVSVNIAVGASAVDIGMRDTATLAMTRSASAVAPLIAWIPSCCIRSRFFAADYGHVVD